MDLILDSLGLVNDSVLELLSLWLDSLVEVLFSVTVSLVAKVESLSLDELNAFPDLHHVWVDVGVELTLGTLDLVLNLVVLEESSRVDVVIQELVNLTNVRSSNLVAMVQVATQVFVCGGKRAEDGLCRQLNWMVHHLGTLVGEKVQAVEKNGEDDQVSEFRKAGHDGMDWIGERRRVVGSNCESVASVRVKVKEWWGERERGRGKKKKKKKKDYCLWLFVDTCT